MPCEKHDLALADYVSICKCPKHVEAIYENKTIVNCCIKLVHLLTYIYMMHGHTYIKQDMALENVEGSVLGSGMLGVCSCSQVTFAPPCI